MNPRRIKALICPRCHGRRRATRCIACQDRGIIALSYYQLMLDTQALARAALDAARRER